MVLNNEDIQRHQLISNSVDANFQDASYSLTVGQIIDMEGKSHDFLKLKPQGMAYVISAETIQLKRDLIGFVHVKTALTKRGVMATNIGVIDPRYHGLISTLLINFGNTDFSIQKDEMFLKVTFSRINREEINLPLLEREEQLNKSPNVYLREVITQTDFLGDKFLNLSSVERDVKKSVINSLLKLGVVFTIGSFLIAAYFQFKISKNTQTRDAIENYNLKVKNLEEELRGFQFEMNNFRDSINKTN